MLSRQIIGVAILTGCIGGILIDAYMLAHPAELAYASDTEIVEKERVIQIGVLIDWTPQRINEEIEEQAALYGRDAEYMKRIIKCESNGSTTIQSFHTKDGIREESYGLVQIHLPSHPSVTKEQAIDPKFAINFMAKNLGKVKWSCQDMI